MYVLFLLYLTSLVDGEFCEAESDWSIWQHFISEFKSSVLGGLTFFANVINQADLFRLNAIQDSRRQYELLRQHGA